MVARTKIDEMHASISFEEAIRCIREFHEVKVTNIIRETGVIEYACTQCCSVHGMKVLY